MVLPLKTVLVLSLLILALQCDIKTYKIKNTLIFPYILLGILINLFVGKLFGIFDWVLGILTPTIFLLPLYLLGMVGAGDIKLFSAIGSIMGYRFVLLSMMLSFLLGGIIALIIAFTREAFKKCFVNLLQYLKTCLLTFSIQTYTKIEDSSNRFPFSIAVVGGTIVSFFLTFTFYY